ncbi:hypothetical protein KUCAC02_018975, partial [Chaenocephalus aceratus]
QVLKTDSWLGRISPRWTGGLACTRLISCHQPEGSIYGVIADQGEEPGFYGSNIA